MPNNNENGKRPMSPEMLELLKAQGIDESTITKAFKPVGLTLPVKSYTEEYLNRFVTRSSKMLELKDEIRKLSKINDCVLIQGETGTGKELLAHALHGDRQGKFIEINCASMPENLLESELFGHRKGAFTGAVETTPGLLKIAANGTMFLDEIGEMPIHLQTKLLKVIQEKKSRKIGDTTEESITCRFIAATNRLLNAESPNFREDLYWRLSTFELFTIPLRNRPEDIEPICRILNPENKLPKEFYNKIIPEKLKGNVRSLEQLVRRYLILGKFP